MKNRIFFVLALLALTGANAQTSETITIEINPEVEYQTVHNFAASDAWSAQFVGNWPEEKKNAMADLLFSTKNDALGNPMGIGLSGWRFNIGGGSREQTVEVGIKDEWRRAEGFLNNDGSYNWNKQAAQKWFVKAAKNRGVHSFIGFVNSPPVQYTLNNKAHSKDGLSANISKAYYDDYAGFLANVVNHFKVDLNVDFEYISPFNEPQWEWKDGQEGSPWNNDELAKATKVIDSTFEVNNISAKIEITEAGAIDFLTKKKKKSVNRSDQIEVFFNKESYCYIGDLKHLAPKIAGHSYFTTYPIEKLKREREAIAQKLEKYPDLEYWMTEYCVLENNDEIKGGKKDLGMKTALYVTRVIHADLTIANASAWHWWLAMSPYNYKDGLIYHDKNTLGGHFQTSKLLWGFGNYSRFIRPGAKRIDVQINGYNTLENLKKGLLVSGYKNSDGSIVLVLVNQSQDDVEVNLGDELKIENIYTTNEALDLKKVDIKSGSSNVKLTSKSINTIII